MRGGVKFGDASMCDTMLRDGLTDAFENGHMGNTGDVKKITVINRFI